MELKNVSTRELVEELQNREGVYGVEVAPYKDYMVNVTGPVIVIVVED